MQKDKPSKQDRIDTLRRQKDELEELGEEMKKVAELPLEPWARFIPIEEIPLHDRPSADYLDRTVEVLRSTYDRPGTFNHAHTEMVKSVAAWLERVAKIPERD